MSTVDKEGTTSRYIIPMDEEVSKGRMHIIKDKLDALIYFHPEGTERWIMHA